MMDERATDIIHQTLTGFEWVLGGIAAVLLIYLIIKRIIVRKKQDFEYINISSYLIINF